MKNAKEAKKSTNLVLWILSTEKGKRKKVEAASRLQEFAEEYEKQVDEMVAILKREMERYRVSHNRLL